MAVIKMKERVKEFLECLGNGKTIYECEAENDMIDEYYLEKDPFHETKQND